MSETTKTEEHTIRVSTKELAYLCDIVNQGYAGRVRQAVEVRVQGQPGGHVTVPSAKAVASVREHDWLRDLADKLEALLPKQPAK